MSTQQSLEGMEAKVIPEITAKAGQYKKVQRDRIALLAEEVKLKGELLALMHFHQLPAYHDPDDEVTVTITPGKEKLKVKLAGEDEEGESEE